MIVIFYLRDNCPMVDYFGDAELGQALTKAAELRQSGFKHVCISSEPGNLVGKIGVDSVNDGLLPDGKSYEWSKAHRAGLKVAPTMELK